MSGLGRRTAPLLVIAPLAFLVVVPMVLMLAAGFLPTRGQPGGITLQHYVDLSRAPWFLSTILSTLGVSLVATLLAFVLGAPIAWAVARTNVPAPQILHLMCVSTLFLSPLLTAVAWDMLSSSDLGLMQFLTFGLLDFSFNLHGFGGCAVVMGFYFSSYVFLYLWPAFRNVDPSIEEAAALAGLGPFSTFLRITLPTVLPAIAFVGILVVVLASGLFSIPAVLGWPYGFFVLSTRIYFMLSLPPIDWGLASALTVTFLPLILFGMYVQRRLVKRANFTLVSGKSARDAVVHLGWARWAVTAAIAVYWLLSVAIPLVVMIVVSLTAYAGSYDHLSLQQYRSLFDYDLFPQAIVNSLLTAVMGATLALVLSVGLAYLIQRARPRWAIAVEYLVSLPLGIPGLVLSAALLWTWLVLPGGRFVYGTLFIIVIACITQFLTTGVRAVSAVMVQIGRDVEESAWLSGASRPRAVRSILVPLMASGLQSGWIMLFVLFFRELSAVILLWSSRTMTLPVLIFETWREGSYPRLAALGVMESLLIAAVVGCVGLAGLGVRAMVHLKRQRRAALPPRMMSQPAGARV